MLEESRHRLKRGKAFVLTGLTQVEASLADVDARLLAELQRSDREPLTSRELAERIKLSVEDLEPRLLRLTAAKRLCAAGRGPRYASMEVAKRDSELLLSHLEAWLKANPERQQVPRGELETLWKGGLPALDFALEAAQQFGRLERLTGGHYRPMGRTVSLDPRSKALADELERGGLQPKMLSELAGSPADEARTKARLDGLVDQGLAVRAAPGLYFAKSAFERAVTAVKDNCQRHGQLEIPELREHLGTTRKFLIPLLEHLDAIGLTRRQGAHRVLRRS